jgi:subfamily B ATP-binding cassette protein MsbA
VLWRGTALILANAMTVGALTVFLAYLSKFFKPVQDLAKMTNTIAQTGGGSRAHQHHPRGDDVIPEKADAASRRSSGRDRVRARGVRVQPGRAGADRRELHREAGQVIGVVGGTGSGKSTIVSLIPRFYDVDRRARAHRRHRRARLRAPPHAPADRLRLQETVLFRGSIRDNIAYGRPGGATDDEIVAAAKLANAHEFIEKMAQGYDTVVGERGDTLVGRPAPAHRHRAAGHPRQPDPDPRRARPRRSTPNRRGS